MRQDGSRWRQWQFGHVFVDSMNGVLQVDPAGLQIKQGAFKASDRHAPRIQQIVADKADGKGRSSTTRFDMRNARGGYYKAGTPISPHATDYAR